MSKFKLRKVQKKPVMVDAIQIDNEVFKYPEAFEQLLGPAVEVNLDALVVEIHALEGVETGRLSDWIIKGVEGELYPCNNRIFRKTYVLLQDDGD